MNAYGNVSKILKKIKDAKTPDRFTLDFLGTNLGFKGGGARPFIPLAKRLGLLNSDGTPTEVYKRFRGTDSESKQAIAEGIRRGYPSIFARNEYAYRLPRKELEGLVTEMTGLDAGSGTIKAIVATFEALKQFADFEAKPEEDETNQEDKKGAVPPTKQPESLHLTYTINLNLPSTSDIAVFNAIFKALREHLLAQ
jgi:Family of unknown function (DUF5343)